MGTEQDRESVGGQGAPDQGARPRNRWWFQESAPIDRFTGWLVLWTALLFAANVVTNFFIYQQWSVANKAQTDTREQLRAVVAYVGTNQLITNDKSGNPAYYSVVPIFQNFGGTRTSHFTGWANIHYFEGEVPNNIDFTKPWAKIDVAESIIGPNGIFQMAPLSFTAEQVQHAQQKEGILLLWGSIGWSDIFEPQLIHTIGICTLYTATPNTNTGAVVIVPSPYRNDCNTNK